MLTAESIVVLCKGHPAVRHTRIYEQHQMRLKLEHYLPLLRRKCRGLDRSVPFRQWALTADSCWKSLLTAIRQRLGEVDGSREFVDIIGLCQIWDTARVTEAVKKTLAHPEVSMSTVRFFLWRKRESERPRAELIDRDGPQVKCGSTSDYGALCEADNQEVSS